MPRCSVLSCGMKKDKHHPHITLHSLPRSKILQKKWLDVIGSENLNPNVKTIFICSIHFDESCFNRTLDVTRLRDNSIPSLHLKSYLTQVRPINSFSEISNTEKQLVRPVNVGMDKITTVSLSKDVHDVAENAQVLSRVATASLSKEVHVLASQISNDVPTVGVYKKKHVLAGTSQDMVLIKRKEILQLKKKFTDQQRKIKRLNSTVYRQRKKLAVYGKIIMELKEITSCQQITLSR